MKFKLLQLFLLSIAAQASYADIPNNYQPMVVEAPFSLSERVFDLTPALEESKKVKKPILIYFGAADCPPCKVYTAFLKDKASELQPHFSKYVVVDIRTWLKGGKIHFQIHDKKFTSKEFLNHIGDENKDLRYPSWWTLDQHAKVTKQLPRGIDSYIDVESHKQLLSVAK